MPLNQVQIEAVTDAVRPKIRSIVRFIHYADTFVQWYDAFQLGNNALPTDGTVLDDAGGAPRDDVPNLTGTDILNLRNFLENIVAQVPANALSTLIAKLDDPLETVIGEGY